MSLSTLSSFLICAGLWPVLIDCGWWKRVVLNGRCPVRRLRSDWALVCIYLTIAIYLLYNLAYSPSFELFLAWFVLPYWEWVLAGRVLIFWWTFRTVLVEFHKDSVWIVKGWSRTKLPYPVGFSTQKYPNLYRDKKYMAYAVTILADSTSGVMEVCHLDNHLDGEKAIRLLNNTEAQMRRNNSARSF